MTSQPSDLIEGVSAPAAEAATVDSWLLKNVTLAVRASLDELAKARPGEALACFALMTDDDLWTALAMAITDGDLASSSDPDLFFNPNDWPHDLGRERCNDISRWLREHASKSESHVEVVALIRAGARVTKATRLSRTRAARRAPAGCIPRAAAARRAVRRLRDTRSAR